MTVDQIKFWSSNISAVDSLSKVNNAKTVFSLPSPREVLRHTLRISILNWNHGDVNLSINRLVLYHVKPLFNNLDQVRTILEPWSCHFHPLATNQLFSNLGNLTSPQAWLFSLWLYLILNASMKIIIFYFCNPLVTFKA